MLNKFYLNLNVNSLLNNRVYLSKHLVRRNFTGMSQKVQKNGREYLAIKIPEKGSGGGGRCCSFLFKRYASGRISNLDKSELKRLFSLAKPERWKLLGKLKLPLLIYSNNIRFYVFANIYYMRSWCVSINRV